MTEPEPDGPPEVGAEMGDDAQTDPGAPPWSSTGDEPASTSDVAASGEPDTDLAWDLPESDRAYVMASLTRLSGDQAEFSARLRVAEDRIEDLAVGFDGIEDAAADASSPASSSTADRTDGAARSPMPGAAGDPHGTEDDAAGAVTDAGREGIDMVELVAWVRDHVALLLERKLPQTGTPPHWCRKWWMHAEAIARFEALRRGWVEAVSSDGNAMVVWFEHLDLMLAVLMGDGGTFSGCTNGDHYAGAVRMLGHDEPSPAYFADFDLLDTG